MSAQSESDSEFQRFMHQSFSTTADDSLSTAAASESGDDTVSRHSEAHGPVPQHLGQDDKAGDPPPVSSWLKPTTAESTTQRAAVDRTQKAAVQLGEERPESTLSQPFGDYSKDSLEESTRKHGFGEDTLQELAEKKSFFAALEAGRLTPVDYAALNHQLTLSSTAPVPLADTQTRDLRSQQSTPLTVSSSSVGSSSQRAGSSTPVPVTEQEGPVTIGVAGLGLQGQSPQAVSSYGSEVFESGDEDSEATTSHTSSTTTQLSSQSDVRGFDLSSVHQTMAASNASHRRDVSPTRPHPGAQETNGRGSPPQSQQVATEDCSSPAAPQDTSEVTSGMRGFDLFPVHAVEVSELLPQPVQSGGPGPKPLSHSATSLHEEGTQASLAEGLTETKHSLSALMAPPLHSLPRKPGDLSPTVQRQSSIEQDLEEVQQALRAAGLEDLDSVEATTHVTESADLRLVLRELATAEVVSVSQELLHQSQGAGAGTGDSPMQSTLHFSSKDQEGEALRTPLSPSGRTPAPVANGPGPHPQKTRPTSSKLPVATRRLPGPRSQVCGAAALPASPSVSKEGSLARELKLLKEVSRWQEMWQSEKEHRECVEQEHAAQEVKSRQREELARLTHLDEVQQLKEELFAVSRKIRKQGAKESAASGDRLTAEEREQLEKNIREQEKLMEGYQKENERLYSEVQKAQKELKSVKDTWTEEVQCLRAELANERVKTERQLRPTHSVKAPPDSPLREQVSTLEEQVRGMEEDARRRASKAAQLEQMVSSYEHDLRKLTQERDGLRKELAGKVCADELDRLVEQHREEVSSLEGKLKWYAENQQLVDRDCAVLKERERVIEELRAELAAARAQVQSQGKAAKERAADARRICDLERQIREMETIIRRRFPNSITALIYAASHNEGEGGGLKDEKEPAPSVLYFEKKVRKLEHELEERDAEHSRRIRALQQQYTAMELRYEEELKLLKVKLKSLTVPEGVSSQVTHPHTTVQALHKELQQKKTIYEARIAEMGAEIKRLKKPRQKQLADVTDQPLMEDAAGGESTAVRGQQELLQLKREYQQMRRERDTLAREVVQLQGQLSERNAAATDPSELESRLEKMTKEKSTLEQQLSQWQVVMTHERVQWQGQLAHTESAARQTREEMEEKLKEAEAQRKREIGELVLKHATEHSGSVVVRMRAQLADKEVEVARLKERLEESQLDQDALVAAQLRQRSLVEQVKSLSADLMEAKRYHTPEMHHYSILLSRISGMEDRLRGIQEKRNMDAELASRPSQRAFHEIERKWSRRLVEKNAEIETFRAQLDEVLETLETLRTHFNAK